VPHEAKVPSNSDSLRLYRRKSIKLVGASFAVVAISLLFARSYFINTANQFISEEYAAYYAGNRTYIGPPVYSDPMPFIENPQPSQGVDEANFTNPDSPLMPPNITVSSHVAMTLEGPRDLKFKKRVPHHGFLNLALMMMIPHHDLQQSVPGYNPGSSTGPNPGYDQGGHRHGTPYIDIDLENWDYANIPEADAKRMAKSAISFMALAIFGYATFLYALFSGLAYCIVNRTVTAAIFHENCQQALRQGP